MEIYTKAEVWNRQQKISLPCRTLTAGRLSWGRGFAQHGACRPLWDDAVPADMSLVRWGCGSRRGFMFISVAETLNETGLGQPVLKHFGHQFTGRKVG